MRAALIVVLLGWASSALAAPLRATAAAGLVATSGLDHGSFALRPMTGPVLQVGLELGDWWDSQFLVQATRVSGEVEFPGSPLRTRDRVQTLLGGYQLTLDVFGKQGAHGFTPYLGGGLLFGVAQVEVDGGAPGSELAALVVSAGATPKHRNVLAAELHAVVGLRYHLGHALGLHGELAYSTYGGLAATWEPKLGLDYLF